MILDTHVWYWFVTGNETLPQKLAKRIEKNASGVVIPSIVLWEFHLLVERKRVTLRSSVLDFIYKARRALPFSVEPLTDEIALASRTLEFEPGHEDPADRFIAATAHCLNTPLVTRDARLLTRKWIDTIEA